MYKVSKKLVIEFSQEDAESVFKALEEVRNKCRGVDFDNLMIVQDLEGFIADFLEIKL